MKRSAPDRDPTARVKLVDATSRILPAKTDRSPATHPDRPKTGRTEAGPRPTNADLDHNGRPNAVHQFQPTGGRSPLKPPNASRSTPPPAGQPTRSPDVPRRRQSRLTAEEADGKLLPRSAQSNASSARRLPQ